jgi:UDP-N-acetyl-D-galactosamine dehydrogenase
MITNPRVCVIGIGYVGLPLTYLLRQWGTDKVFAVDLDYDRIRNARCGLDHTGMIPSHVLDEYHDTIMWEHYTPLECDYYIICVPTPDNMGDPDYSFVKSACKSAIEAAGDHSTIVLESTVAPGTCRDLVASLIPKDKRIAVAYSPERINPGETAYDEMRQSRKLVASDTPNDRRIDALLDLYNKVFRGGTLLVEDTRVAELAKCFENTQRDLNIAMMNELSMQCHKEGVDFKDVTAALRTKPSSPVFNSGMVGGHCIPVDPYYLAQWYNPDRLAFDLPSAGRTVNERFIKYVTSLCTRVNVESPRNVLIVGATYKPDIADVRNSGPCKVEAALTKAGIRCEIYDPVIEKTRLTPLRKFNVVVAAVNHTNFKGMCLAADLPLAIDCTVINVGGFSASQLSGIKSVINL